MEKVGFIGSPRAGQVARQVLSMGSCELLAWQPDEVDGEADQSGDLPAVTPVELDELAEVPLIVLSTGIAQCRGLARRLGDVITGRHVVVHTIRAVEAGTHKTASQILFEETPTRRIGFVTGPLRLNDLRQERPASAVCSSHFPEVHDLVEDAMMSGRVRIYHSRDLIGAELSSIYARVIALICGIGEGMGFGASLQATLFARGLAEMARFVVHQDGYERTSFGLSGTGNLQADIYDEGSIDFQMGQHLAAHPTDASHNLEPTFGDDARELMDALAAFGEISEESELELHLLDAVLAIVDAQIPPMEMVKGLMQLPALYE